MAWFPFFVSLEGASGLLVGGGRVALRKMEKLLSYGPHLTVIAPDICPELEQLATSSPVTLQRRPFEESDLNEELIFVIAATGDRELNHRIAQLCRQRRILVNVVDDLQACGFLFPALVQRGRLSVGISTGGASPSAAIWLKEAIERLLPEHFAGLLDRLASRRAAQKAKLEDATGREAAFRQEFQQELAASGRDSSPHTTGRVALVGAGCGKADLITLRGLRLLNQCKAVVYDDLIDAELLQQVPSHAQRVYVGKRSGRQGVTQEEINQLLIDLAQKDGLVVRLKGGDPFVFGRGGEEILALQQAGVDFEVVPGISSAIAIPAEAGIPVTHRAMSRSLHIITAHTLPGEQPDFRRYGALDGTLVFLMGLQRLSEIAQGLMDGGMDGSTPAAVISGGNSPHCTTVRAPLSGIVSAARQAEIHPPAVIVVGETAALNLTANPQDITRSHSALHQGGVVPR